MPRYTPQQAAEILGISTEAIRQRIRRGSLPSEKAEDGRVYVHLDASQQRTDDVRTDERTLSAAHLDSLQDQITYLRQQLEQANERDREQRRIIAALTQRIPELPSNTPPEATERPTETSESSGKGTAPPAPQTATQRRSWWQRIFGQ